MKTFLHFLLALLLLQTSNAQSEYKDASRNILEMTDVLLKNGITELLKQAKEKSWKTPHIPSQWHVEHVSTPEQKPIDIATRDFGKKLAEQLSVKASKMQQLPIGDELYSETTQLLDLSDWCVATDGYGNIYLAQRCFDIAAVGIARLSANLDFPMEKIDTLFARINPEWMSAESCQRVLNKDAGANIFPTANREEIERIWGSGRILRRDKDDPTRRIEREKSGVAQGIRETPVMTANLAFFDDVDLSQVRPVTLVTMWSQKWHERIVNGLELQSIQKAKALAEFRRDIGRFPDKPIFTEQQLREREQGKAEAAKAGLKVSNMEDSYSSLQAAAFALAWKGYLEKQKENFGKLPPQRYNLDVAAYQAYDEVQRGDFLDHDTAETKFHTKSSQTK